MVSEDERRTGIPPRRARSVAFVVALVALTSPAFAAAPDAPVPARPELLAPQGVRATACFGEINEFALDQNGKRMVLDANGPEPSNLEIVKFERWVVVTGTLDHSRLKEHYARALKLDPKAAHPDYRRVELQRQERKPGGLWSEWKAVDAGKNRLVSENFAEAVQEPTPNGVRLDALAEVVPFLRAGEHRGHLVEALIPPNLGERVPEPTAPARGARDFPKSQAARLLVRKFDFTVEPEVAYRYRARILVRDPRTEVEPYKPEPFDPKNEWAGPWSEPTAEVIAE
jgi:hypothetical protein